MAKIVFSKHAKTEKFALLEKHGFKASAKTIKNVKENDIIKIITFYPAERGRYY